MSRTLLVTVSDDRFGRKDGAYKATQLKIAHLLLSHNPGFGLELEQYDWPKIKESYFYAGIRVLLDNIDPARNGRAYKPLVIQQELTKLEYGDYLVYNDCSPELWQLPFERFPFKYDLAVLHSLTKHNGDILSAFVKWDTQPTLTNGLGIHTHDNFTLDRCIERMGMEAYRHDFQHASGFICLRKTEETMAFVREWCYWNCMDECASMGWASIPDDYSFWAKEEYRKMGHRHDQSISGLLINKRGGMLVDLPPYEGINPYNFLQYCRRDVQYQFISSRNPSPPPEDRIRKGSIVKNRKGTEMYVFEFAPENGVEYIVVGKHRESCYKTTREHLTLIKP